MFVSLVWSCVTVNCAVAVLPAASLATSCTAEVPRGKTEADGGAATTATALSTLSVAVAAKSTAAPAALAASTASRVGTLITGGAMSATVMVIWEVAVYLAASVAVSWTVEVPIGKVLPEAGVAVTATGPSTQSTALAENSATAPDASAATMGATVGADMAGGVLSATVTVNEAEPVLPGVLRIGHGRKRG